MLIVAEGTPDFEDKYRHFGGFPITIFTFCGFGF